LIRTPNSLAHLEIDEEEVKEKAYKVFNGRFGSGFVTKVFLGKYPEGYELVVYVKDKKDLKNILELSHSLSDEFNAQGLPIAVSTAVSEIKHR
jgi:hypothetical protein